jgi:hypothetical protein
LVTNKITTTFGTGQFPSVNTLQLYATFSGPVAQRDEYNNIDTLYGGVDDPITNQCSTLSQTWVINMGVDFLYGEEGANILVADNLLLPTLVPPLVTVSNGVNGLLTIYKLLRDIEMVTMTFNGVLKQAQMNYLNTEFVTKFPAIKDQK